MTKHDLKELSAMGAELGAAKAEVERLRGLLREVRVLLANSSYKISGTAAFLSSIDNALSQQPEPTDTYTAVDMATAAAQGFRDGQAAVEQAAAQDEWEAFDLFPDQLEALAERLKQYREAHKDDVYSPEEVLRQCQSWAVSDQYYGTGVGDSFQRAADVIEALLTRPAQTEQQPIQMPNRAKPEHPLANYHRGHADGWNAALDEVARLNAAPIAQTAPQGTTSDSYRAELYDEVWGRARSMGYVNVTDALIELERMKAAPQPEQSGKFAMHQRVRKTSGSEWQGRICGTYSTALTPEGYAVESEAHAGSVQIYPAKALEAVR